MVSIQGTGRRLLDRYSLLELVGQSSTTRVWRARDERADREVAVKEFRIPPHLDDVEQAILANKLVRMGQDTALFTHPGAVEVYDVFQESGTPFVVMELFNGPTLTQVVADRGTLAPDAAAHIGRQLLATLTAAHAAGVVHRGVRPGNVVLVDETTARLADFGTPSVVPDPDGRRSPFCAPEQTATTGAGPAADLWSLGATLHFAVEGTPPSGRAGDTEGPSGPGEEREAQPPDSNAGSLAPVLEALLARDPASRPDTSTTENLLARAAGAGEASQNGESAARAARQSGEPSAPGGAGADSDADTATETEASSEEAAAAAPARTVREPWFFPVPVEVQPDSKLVTLTAAAAGDLPPPKPPPSRFYGGMWVTVLAVGMSLFLLVALVLVRGGDGLNVGNDSTVVPADWVVYQDPVVGYTISHPPGWSVTRVGPTTELRDPSTGAVLVLETAPVSGLSPRSTALNLEREFASENANYHRVRMVTSRFRGYPASVWEYTYTAGGEEMRAVQLGVVTDTQQITLLFKTNAADWERHQPDLAGFEASLKGF